MIPDPEDCSKYYVCNHIGTQWATVHSMSCPAGLHFNSELNVCDWPDNAKCGGDGGGGGDGGDGVDGGDGGDGGDGVNGGDGGDGGDGGGWGFWFYFGF